MNWMHSTMMMMKTPGHENSHGRVVNAPWYWLISEPSEMSGGRMPKPRKLSAASVRMPAPSSSVMLTTITPTVFGRMCLKMIRADDAPATRAASTNSRSRRARNSPRTSRASPVQRNRPEHDRDGQHAAGAEREAERRR